MQAHKGEGDRLVSAVLQLLLWEFFYSLGRENSNHPGSAFQDAFDRRTETPSRESASHQMTHWLLKAGFAFSFPLADAAGELMTHEGYTFRDAFGKCVTVTPSCESESASHQMTHWLA
jgi:hypothetical protein